MSSDFQTPAHAALDPVPLVYEEAHDDVARFLAARFGSSEVLRAVTGHRPPRGYYRARTADRDDLFIKVVNEEALPRLARADESASLLAAQGLPILAMLGKPMSAGAGFVALAYRWVDGRFARSEVADMRAVGGALGGLHIALRGGPFAEPADTRQVLDEIRNSLDMLMSLGDLSPSVAAATTAMLSQWPPVAALLVRGAQPIHNDFHRGNVLFSDTGRVAAILDFEDSVGASASPIVDIATAVERFCLVGTEPHRGRLLSRELIAAYRAAAPAALQFAWSEIATVAMLRSLHALGLLARNVFVDNAGWSSEWRKFEWLIQSWSDWKRIPVATD